VVKTLPSSFVGTGLDALLRESGIQTLIVTGLMSHIGIMATDIGRH
jgi:nicotinamidase-related amidase